MIQSGALREVFVVVKQNEAKFTHKRRDDWGIPGTRQALL